MRRGYTLMELVVAMALLAVLVTVATRLLFTADRALGEEGERAAAVGGQGELLADLGRDLRPASAVYTAGGTLAVGAITWRSGEDGVRRQVAGRPELARRYPNVQARFSRSGALVIIELSTPSGPLRTGFALRN